ncbi:MAG: tetratricopeptide repeat protein [Kofleriaceae bacterium]
MGAALILLLVGLGAMAAGVLIGRYYVPDDRQLRRTAKHSRSYMRALAHLIARDHETVVSELRAVVEENVDDVEPYFALGALFRHRGEHERAIRVHQALAVRERDRRNLRHRAMYELGLDFRAAGMPRRATKAMEEVLQEEPEHEGGLRVLAALYEEQGRFHDAAELARRLGKLRADLDRHREHHLLVAGAQAALARGDLPATKHLLKSAQRITESAHYYIAVAELAAARHNHRGAKDRLKQALIADPTLAPLVLPGLIAAEQGLLAAPGAQSTDDLDESRPIATADATPSEGVALVPAVKPTGSAIPGVLAALAEVEAQTGARLELALIRAQLVEPDDAALVRSTAEDLVVRFPDALAARVTAARLALTSGDADRVRDALQVLVADHGALGWALRGRWQCAHCGHRPASFSWRCSQCRRWATLRMETGIEPAPAAPRERRAMPRGTPVEGLLGGSPDQALPAATLDHGLPPEHLVRIPRRSLLGRVGGWFTGIWQRPRQR